MTYEKSYNFYNAPSEMKQRLQVTGSLHKSYNSERQKGSYTKPTKIIKKRIKLFVDDFLLFVSILKL